PVATGISYEPSTSASGGRLDPPVPTDPPLPGLPLLLPAPVALDPPKPVDAVPPAESALALQPAATESNKAIAVSFMRTGTKATSMPPQPAAPPRLTPARTPL